MPSELGGGLPLFTELPRRGVLGKSTYPRGHKACLTLSGRVKHENSLPYTSASSTSGTSSFSKARKWRAGIWLAGNLRVEVVADCLYSPLFREQSFSGNSEKTCDDCLTEIRLARSMPTGGA